ncbi:MAG: hypothetical protein AB9846_17960 [Tenuifilaceae bacterium]
MRKSILRSILVIFVIGSCFYITPSVSLANIISSKSDNLSEHLIIKPDEGRTLDSEHENAGSIVCVINSISTNQLSFGSIGTEDDLPTNVMVYTSGCTTWTFTVGATWIHAFKMSGKLSIFIDQNTGPARNSTITFPDNPGISITISQSADCSILPTITGTTPNSRCSTGTVYLAATASSGTVNWYNVSSGGSPIGTSNGFTTPSINTTTTYFVGAVNANGCSSASRTAVTATVNAIPSISGVTHNNRCGSGEVQLGATASSGTVNWYNVSSGGSPIAYGSNFSPNLSSSATYYVDATSSGCTTASRTGVNATIKTIPSITSTTPGTRCGTGTVILSATASAGTINWFTVDEIGVGVGSTITSPSITNTTTYYVGASANGCNSVLIPITASVKTIPTISATTPNSRCGSGALALGATATAGTVSWYAASSGGTALASGTSYSPSPSSTTTYWVDATDNGCTTTSRSSVAATIKTIPTISATTPNSRCGSGALALGATATAGTVSWYAASSGGTALASGTSYSPSPSSTTTYWVDATDNGCTTTSRSSVAATIKTIPTISATTPNSRCGSGALALGATATAGTVSWYAASSGGTALASGTSYSPSPSSTTTYWVDATDNGCTTTSRSSVAATIKTIPTISATTPNSRCGSGALALGATATAGTVSWYTASSGGTALASGTSYSPSPSGTTTYWVDATDNGCTTTSRTSVLGTILQSPSAYNVIGGGGYCVDGSGVSINLDGSEPGISYLLKSNGSTISSLNGTGSTLSFANQTFIGIYTIEALNSTTGCNNSMTETQP